MGGTIWRRRQPRPLVLFSPSQSAVLFQHRSRRCAKRVGAVAPNGATSLQSAPLRARAARCLGSRGEAWWVAPERGALGPGELGFQPCLVHLKVDEGFDQTLRGHILEIEAEDVCSKHWENVARCSICMQIDLQKSGGTGHRLIVGRHPGTRQIWVVPG